LSLLPEVFKSIRLDAAPEGDDVICALDGPEHAGVFEALSDDALASGFDDAGAEEEALFFELLVAHGVGVFLEVPDGAECFLAGFSCFGEAFAHVAEEGLDVAGFEEFEPLGAEQGAEFLGDEEFDGGVDVLLGMAIVNDVDGVGEVQVDEGFVVAGAVGEDDDPGVRSEAAAEGFGVQAFAEGVAGFDGADVGGAMGVADGVALCIEGGLGEYAADLDLAGFGGAIGLFARSTGQLSAADGNAGAVEFEVQDRRAASGRLRVLVLTCAAQEFGVLTLHPQFDVLSDPFGLALDGLGGDREVGIQGEVFGRVAEGRLTGGPGHQPQGAGGEIAVFDAQGAVGGEKGATATGADK